MSEEAECDCGISKDEAEKDLKEFSEHLMTVAHHCDAEIYIAFKLSDSSKIQMNSNMPVDRLKEFINSNNDAIHGGKVITVSSNDENIH